MDENDEKAVECFRKAADGGNADDLFYVGRCYEEGKGVKPDKKIALNWYKEAAMKGNDGAVRRCRELAEAGNAGAKEVLKLI